MGNFIRMAMAAAASYQFRNVIVVRVEKVAHLLEWRGRPDGGRRLTVFAKPGG